MRHHRRMQRGRIRRVAAVVVAGAALVAACGGDDDDGAAAGTEPAAATTPVTDAPTATEAPGTTSAPAPTDAPASSDDPVGEAAFPVSIEHKFGTTTIEAEPQRVVSVGFNDQDALLALGVVPVGIREWYGEQPFATWPWAIDALGDAEPEVLASAELNFEQITALEPDLIVGLSSGMTESEYATLSGIAPTIAQSAEYIEYGVPWDVGTLTVGRAVGRVAEAEALVTEVQDRIAAEAAAHPEWAGQEVAVGYVLSDTEIGAYASGDPRPQLLAQLGLVTPAEFDELAGDLFYSSFSFEEIGRLDRDVLVWIASTPEVMAQIEASPLRPTLQASTEGREVFLGQLEAGAFSFGSVLSLPYLLDALVPQIEAAIDGDPATVVPAAE
jgi:iron complex transport system substrate-binding protein